jgi:hypothetical protein
MDSIPRSNAARRGAKLAGLVLCAGALAWAAPALAGDAETVTYVDSVDCRAGRCEARRKTVPLQSTVREPVAGGVCVEYARRIVAFTTFPTRDPAMRLEVPQYEVGPARQVACERAPAHAVVARNTAGVFR